MTDMTAVFAAVDDINAQASAAMVARLTGDIRAYNRGMRRYYRLVRVRDGLVTRWAKGL